MKTPADILSFPHVPQLGGPLTQDQLWQGIMRMSEKPHTSFSVVEHSVYSGYKLTETLDVNTDLPKSEVAAAANVEQESGKLVSSVT